MKAKRIFRFLAWGFVICVIATQLCGCSGIDISPDGKRVVFVWPRDSSIAATSKDENPASDSPLAIMNIDGTGFRYIPNSDGAGPPKWSPSGKFIAYELDGSLKVLSVETFGAESVGVEGVNGYTWATNGHVLEIIGWEDKGDRRMAYWYDMPTRKIVQKLELASGPGGDLTLQPIADSMSFVYSYNSGLWLVGPDQERQIVKDVEVEQFRVSQNGSKILFSVSSEDPTKRLIDLFEYSIADGNVRQIPFPDILPNVNAGTPAKARTARAMCFSPDLTKMLLAVEYDARNPDGSPQVRSFLIDLVSREVTPIWLKGEAGSFAVWSPKGDSFMLWTLVSMPGRSAVSLRWFPADASFSIPILTAHEKYIPGTSSKVSGGLP